ncbi:gametogenetin-binding protein 2-like [Mizuhopecten yessoensis]|uniref:Gametogenetin-binding protein 2 n=1 Tax=Mizuhopecten yessoensis TaxID=6573 RepID=A0A210Q6G5_MIZYE|nr:gametogenetin-binding protein 2-like [Mizuhopecten yessoensis]OWF44311.1 Gametogenetin-binding protein 2 [Mizuhopecten yessoensis]
MARLVGVCKTDDYQFLRRQLPITVDDDLKMVIQFNDTCVDCESARGIKQKELELFVQRFSALTKDEIAVEMMVSSKNIMNLLTHLVPCVGCRRSVERMFHQLVDSQHPALEPLIVTQRAELSINRDNLFDPRSLYALFNIHRAKLNSIMESIPKSKKNKRCNLHSLDTHKPRTTGSWIEIWDLLAQECREEVVLIDADSLSDTLEAYLRKHRFCSECKSKVQRAYNILVEDLDCTKEVGYCAALYEGLRCCPHERHIHMLCDTDFIAHLIGRAEPELAGGSRRDRHAKTLDIAQEEVLTCLGIHIYDRLHRIWQKLKAEEQTWQILFYLGVDALKKSFEMALERKQGISNLELMCEEILEEERAKEQKREQKRQKRKKKKAKSNQLVLEKENCAEDPEEETHCECDKVATLKPRTTNHGPCAEKCGIFADQNSNTTLASRESCRGGQSLDRPLRSESQNSDFGYSSDVEGCENCSAPSSSSSDILCSDGVCSSQDGGDSVCSSSTDGLDTCSNCLSQVSPNKQNSHRSKHKCDILQTSESCSSANSSPLQQNVTMSLLDMLEAPCSSEDDDFITEEEIKHFKANKKKILEKRQELREDLRKKFNTKFQQQGADGQPYWKENLDNIVQKMCKM